MRHFLVFPSKHPVLVDWQALASILGEQSEQLQYPTSQVSSESALRLRVNDHGFGFGHFLDRVLGPFFADPATLEPTKGHQVGSPDCAPVDVNHPAFDAAGNSYLAGSFTGSVTIGGMAYNSAGSDDIVVVKLDQDGGVVWARTAGGTASDYVNAMALDGDGNVYLADTGNHRIRQITPSGFVRTICGTGVPGTSVNGVLPTNAQLVGPYSVAVDDGGNIFVGDQDGGRIYRFRIFE